MYHLRFLVVKTFHPFGDAHLRCTITVVHTAGSTDVKRPSLDATHNYKSLSSSSDSEVQDSTRLEPASAVNEISNLAQLQGERLEPSFRAEIVALSGRKRFPKGAFLSASSLKRKPT